MNGVHDMGGMDGFGKVEAEQNEPPFHEPWEGRVLAMKRAMGATGVWNIDMSRFARTAAAAGLSRRDLLPEMVAGLRNMLVERGFIDADEVEAGHALRPGKPLKRGPFGMKDVERVLNRAKFGRPHQHRAEVQARRQGALQEHQSGDAHAAAALRARPCRRGRAEPRLPRVPGLAPSIDGAENPQWLYTVVFDEPELWGADADPTVKISIDAFEPYLDPA